MKRPELFNDKTLMDFSAKKVRRIYGISAEKWFLAKKLSQQEYEMSEANFTKLSEVGDHDVDAINECLESAREFVQIHFRKEDPSSHVLKLKVFWKVPNGLIILNSWFEWLVGGSDNGNISNTIEEKIDDVMIIIDKILGDQKGDEWVKQARDMENSCREKNGNSIMFYVYLLRELAKSWKNQPEKVIFIEGEDDLKDASNQPFLHIVKVPQDGLLDNVESIVISVRVGTTMIFEDVSLCQGLAAMIQITFSFNLLYPSQADDIFNFLQRTLARFGPADGARNSKDHIKKNFSDFQCTLGKLVLQQKKGNVQKMLI